MVRALLARYRAFLFRETSPVPLARLRLVYGLYLLTYWPGLTDMLSLYFGPRGLGVAELTGSPHALVRGAAWLVGIGTAHFVPLFLAVALPASLALALGYATRVTALLVWMCASLGVTYVPVGTNSGDYLVRTTAWLVLVASLAGHTARGRTAPIPMWSTRLFQLQLAIVYLFSGWHKVAHADWYNGTALHYALLQRIWTWADFSFLSEYPVITGLSTYATLAFELWLFPIGVWVRSLRPAVLAAGLAFHVGIALSMKVFVFGAIMPILYLAFVEEEEWAALRALTSRGSADSRRR